MEKRHKLSLPNMAMIYHILLHLTSPQISAAFPLPLPGPWERR